MSMRHLYVLPLIVILSSCQEMDRQEYHTDQSEPSEEIIRLANSFLVRESGEDPDDFEKVYFRDDGEWIIRFHLPANTLGPEPLMIVNEDFGALVFYWDGGQ